jgi:hypothetical protein
LAGLSRLRGWILLVKSNQYRIDKRDGRPASPEFTARLVDRWQG